MNYHESPDRHNSFEEKLARGIGNADSVKEMVDAVTLFYEAGGKITSSNDEEYQLQQLIDGIQLGPGNHLTRKYGIRERRQELHEEQESFELTEQDIEACDNWIQDQCPEIVLQDADTLHNRLQELMQHVRNVEGSAFPKYETRIEQWMELTKTLQSNKANGRAVIESMYPPEVWKAVMG